MQGHARLQGVTFHRAGLQSTLTSACASRASERARFARPAYKNLGTANAGKTTSAIAPSQELMTTTIQRRKDDHLDLCATDEVAFRGATTLLERVQLIHQSLPDLNVDDIDTSVSLLGKKLKLPIVI